MSCQDSLNTLVIFQASYAGDSEVCPYKPEKSLPFKQIFEGKDNKETLTCKEDVTKKIKARCGWTQTCDVTVNHVIGDRCGPGPTRYLSVTYSCGKVPNLILLIVELSWSCLDHILVTCIWPSLGVSRSSVAELRSRQIEASLRLSPWPLSRVA